MGLQLELVLVRIVRKVGEHVGQSLDHTFLGHRFRREVLLGRVLQPHPWVAEHLPSRRVAVPAVDGIGEQSLLQVRAHLLEERPLLSGPERSREPARCECFDQLVLPLRG